MNQHPQHTSPFETIRHEDEQGNEYWSARELGKILGYTTNYRNFQKAIKKAEEACQNSGQAISDHFAYVRNMINTGKGAKRKEAGATLPEDMPTPDKSIRQLQREELQRIAQRQQPALFIDVEDATEQ